jgi:flagellar biosynthesis protein FliR
MWFLIPFLGAAAGAYIGRESPAFVWSMLIVMIVVILIGLGDPALAVQVLGLIIAVVIGLVILYNIIPIIVFLLSAAITLAFIIMVFAGIFKLLGV